jgi:hypothetical protein
MKRLGVIFSFVVALQLIVGDTHLCCLWSNVFSFAAAPGAVGSAGETHFNGHCSSCPKGPAQAPNAPCSCGSMTARDSRPVEVSVQTSHERETKVVNAQAPPVRIVNELSVIGSTHLHTSNLVRYEHRPVYLLNSSFLI